MCAAFLANVGTQSDATVNFNGNSYHLPAWSVSILPDCKNEVLNTAKVSLQWSHVDKHFVYTFRPSSTPSFFVFFFLCPLVLLLFNLTEITWYILKHSHWLEFIPCAPVKGSFFNRTPVQMRSPKIWCL